MATLTQTNLTLSEQMKQIGPSGNYLEIVNVLSQVNEMDIDAPYVMANDQFADVSSKVVSMPTIGNRRINRGTFGGLGRTTQHKEFIEILEARPFIDTLLLAGMPDGGAQARLNQMKIFMEAMAQTKADHLLYGSNLLDGEVIDGFLTRLSDLTASNVYDMGGTGSDTCSILLIDWDPARCNLIFPRAVLNGNSNMGITEVDNGKQRITDDAGGALDVLESVIRVAFGIKVLDDRNIARLANIESDGDANTMFATGQMRDLRKAINNLTSRGRKGNIYCNTDIKTQFDIWASESLGGLTMTKDVWGNPVTSLGPIQIRMMDAMTSTETALA